MKILQLVTRRQYRGAEVFAANLSEELIKLGHEIIFVGLYSNDVNVLSVDKAKNIDLSKRKKEGISPQLVRTLVRIIKEEKPQVVQCNGSDTLKNMVAASYFTKDIPIVYRNISTISEWLDSSLKRKIYKFLFNHVDYVTSVGNESIQDLRETFGYPEHKTAVIRRGIPFKVYDTEQAGKGLREELGLQATDKIAIHVGNFSPEKNHAFLLDLFSEIKDTHPNIKLVCIGNGVTFENILKGIREKGLEQTVFLMGFRKDIPELLAGSDCFVLSSFVEGVPGVILEAAVQKKPSVSTNVGGVQEVISNNETGLIIDNFDKAEFKNAILRIMEDEKLRVEMGENAYKLVLDQFNPTKNAKKFEKLYQDLIEKNKGNGPEEKSQKLKILQIIQKKQFRGAEIFSCQLSNHLLEKGHEVRIYSIYEGTANLPFNGNIYSFKRSKTSRYFDLSGWRSIARVIKDFQPDIVQANASDTLKYTVLSKIIFSWSVPIIYRNASVSSYYIRTLLSKYWNRMLLKQVDEIISVSEWSKKDLNEIFPFTRKKSKVITIGVEEISPDNKSPFDTLHGKNILHVGSLTNEKNHLELLEIFLEVKKDFPESNLHLVGEGPLRASIQEQVQQFGLGESVTLHGEIKEPSKFIQHADVLVLPSLVEGLPGVILEAMMLETPVVAYSVGGIPEVLDETTGFLVDSGNKQKFADTVKSVLSEVPEACFRIAKERVLSRFLNRDLVDKFVESYYEIR